MAKSTAKIALLSMPFGELAAPPIALLQLKAYLAQELGSKAKVDVHYLNHEMALFFEDTELYRHIISNIGYGTGYGDWFFRSAAFPGADDNEQEYFSRYYTGDDEVSRSAKAAAQTHRPLIDNFLDGLIKKHDLANMDIVGFSTIFSQTTASVALANRLKAVNPNITTVMGGSACLAGMGMEFMRQFKNIDYVFSGPGLISFTKFVTNYLEDNMAACDEIAGVFSKTNEARWDENNLSTSMGEELDINTNLILEYDQFLDSFETTFPNSELQPRLLFETSRGCWWGEKMKCSFCGLNGPDICFRAMTPENAIAQIESVLKHKDRCDFFASVDNIMEPGYIKDVFPKIDLPATHKIQYEIRADLDDEQLNTLCKAGVTLLQPGIEALSTETLKLMQKGKSAFSNVKFLKTCAMHPVSMVWSMLIFSPGEEESTYEKYLTDIDKLTHLHPPYAVFQIEYLRYTRYFENSKEFGVDLKPEEFYSLIYPFDEESISRLAFKFFDANADNNKMTHWLGLLNEKVNFWRTRWINEDNLEEARLCLIEDEEGSAIYDSRSGTAKEYELSDRTRKVLSLLEKPLSEKDVADKVGRDVAEEMDYLNQHDLLFEEDGRYISLVII